MQDRFDSCLDGLLPGGGAVLLAVSGGVDSMAMADLAVNSSLPVRFAVAHCNFHLRGDESDADEAFVRDWAGSCSLPFFKADFDTLEYSRTHGISVEMAARELRYTWFASMLKDPGYDAVAVAHNANDNAETLILNLLRGTGIRGISGMRESSFIQGEDYAHLIRPMLGFSREEIQEYALSRGLQWREDSTNADSAYKRNLVRNEIFPLFSRLNPSFLQTLTDDMRRFGEVGRIADDFVALHALEVCRSDIPSDSLRSAPYPGKWSPDGMSERLLSIDIGKLREVLHWEYLLYRLLEPYGFNSSTVDDIIALINGCGTFSGRKFFGDGYLAMTSAGALDIHPLPVPEFVEGPGVTVDGPGEYSLDGTTFLVDLVKVDDPRQPAGTTVAALGFPFTVRRWQAGDWMRPLGMGGRKKKLSDMFTDMKVSVPDKGRALVIPDEGSHVLALVGFRVDESVRTAPGADAVRIRLI